MVKYLLNFTFLHIWLMIWFFLFPFSFSFPQHSGEQSFSCLWVKRRSPNIMEFKFSDKSSSIMNDKLCDDRNFLVNPWITEGSMCFSINISQLFPFAKSSFFLFSFPFFFQKKKLLPNPLHVQ